MTRAPEISSHFQGRSPSAIRQAQILFAQRPDREQVSVINLAIGNVSLPMHPAMRARMESQEWKPNDDSSMAVGAVVAEVCCRTLDSRTWVDGGNSMDAWRVSNEVRGR